MKIHVELDFDGYADAAQDLTSALNVLLDNAPVLLMKSKSLADLLDKILPPREYGIVEEEAPAATVEESATEAPATEAPATPAEEDPDTK